MESRNNENNSKELRMRRSLVKSSGLVNSVTKVEAGCCVNNKSCYIYSIRLNGLLVKYEQAIKSLQRMEEMVYD